MNLTDALKKRGKLFYAGNWTLGILAAVAYALGAVAWALGWTGALGWTWVAFTLMALILTWTSVVPWTATSRGDALVIWCVGWPGLSLYLAYAGGSYATFWWILLFLLVSPLLWFGIRTIINKFRED